MACNITNYVSQWCKVTSDKFIIDIVRHGLRINFTQEPPEREPFEYKRCKQDFLIIEMEVAKIISKEVISESPIESGDYFSNLFTTPKKDGTYRTILNLKHLNQECETSHFKMELLRQAVHMVQPNCYLASIDIKDAFYSVPVHSAHKKYLKFMWVGKAYHYNAMPNGYVDAMRVFTKILKPVFASLRVQGYTPVVYVDDSLLYGLTYEECQTNVMVTLESLQDLGFVIHSTKSVLYPTHVIVFLGFIFNTVKMTLSLTDEKKDRIKKLASELLVANKCTIRMVARFIGNLTASFEAVPGGRLYYRHIELCKIQALKGCKGDYESPCTLSGVTRSHIYNPTLILTMSFTLILVTRGGEQQT